MVIANLVFYLFNCFLSDRLLKQKNCEKLLTPPGVNMGVWGVWGVCVGVACDGVACEGVVCVGVAWDGVGVAAAGVAPGVSSQRERRLVPGVGVSCIVSTPVPRSVRGVSAQPLLCPGVSTHKIS